MGEEVVHEIPRPLGEDRLGGTAGPPGTCWDSILYLRGGVLPRRAGPTDINVPPPFGLTRWYASGAPAVGGEDAALDPLPHRRQPLQDVVPAQAAAGGG